MIISKTPVRLSFFGGGTDYTQYLDEGYEGIVVGGAINKYSYITCRNLPPFHPHTTYLSYSEIERLKDNKDIQHKVIKAVVDYFRIVDGIELCHLADIPSKTGTGSSSAFLVGMINAIATLCGKNYDYVALANTAIHIEQDVLQDTVGLQDSIWAALGGINIIKFGPDRYWHTQTLNLNREDIAHFESNLLLFFSGISRTSSQVASSYVPTLKTQQEQQKRMIELTYKGIETLKQRDFLRLGKLLHESWMIKRSLSPNISNPYLDNLYQVALDNGAVGGKITGSGGGGSLLLVVPPTKRKQVVNSLHHLVQIPFKFSMHGSQIILNNT